MRSDSTKPQIRKPNPAAYAFYMQPMMMALLPEMPAGDAGVGVLTSAVRTTLYGVAFSIYAAMGVCGAALFGRRTKG